MRSGLISGRSVERGVSSITLAATDSRDNNATTTLQLVVSNAIFKLRAEAGGYAAFYENNRRVYFRGGGAYGGRGWNVARINAESGQWIEIKVFDGWASEAELFDFAEYIRSTPPKTLLVVATADDVGLYRKSEGGKAAISALDAIGARKIQAYQFRDSWCAVVLVGSGVVMEEFAAAGSIATVGYDLLVPPEQ